MLCVDDLNYRVKPSGIETERLIQLGEVITDRMAHDHDRAVATLGFAVLNRPGEHLCQHVTGLLLRQEARLAKAVPRHRLVLLKVVTVVDSLLLRVTNTELDVEEMSILLDARVVEVDLLQQVLSMTARLIQRAHVPGIESRDANLRDLVVVVSPTLGVETYDDYAVSQRRNARKVAETETVLENSLASLCGEAGLQLLEHRGCRRCRRAAGGWALGAGDVGVRYN